MNLWVLGVVVRNSDPFERRANPINETAGFLDRRLPLHPKSERGKRFAAVPADFANDIEQWRDVAIDHVLRRNEAGLGHKEGVDPKVAADKVKCLQVESAKPLKSWSGSRTRDVQLGKTANVLFSVI
jgi:hypothetical protein